MRKIFQLTQQEWSALRKLKPIQGEAWLFWGKVAKERGIDVSTIISSGRTFTALPTGHGKHWCYPYTITCSQPPSYT